MTTPDRTPEPGDIVQLDPDSGSWGPLLCIVSDVRRWGVVCYALVPEKRTEPPGLMYLRVVHGEYKLVGRAEWMSA